MSDQFSLSWLHISDIHFGDGEAFARAERREVLDALMADLDSLTERIPTIDQIIVSGDIAFSGGSRSESEYSDARSFLKAVESKLGLHSDAILIAPGNHDVDRGVAWNDHDTRRWLEEMRSGTSIEEAFSSVNDQQRMKARMSKYLDFASNFGGSVDETGQAAAPSISSSHLFSTTLIDARHGLRVRIGMGNTALLSQDDQDHRKLQFGMSQLREIVVPNGDQDVTILVTHHPFDWCSDEDLIEPRLRRWVDLHLCGHVHRPESERRERGSGGNLVRVVAGALHEYDSALKQGTNSFTYSVGALYLDDTGDIWLRIWPRRWTASNAEFRVDFESVPDGHFYVDHRLTHRQRQERERTDSPQAKPIISQDRANAELIYRVSERSIRQLGARRTAYPLDMSISELYERGLYIETALVDMADNTERAMADIVDQVRNNRSVLVLGEPGSGKSVSAYALLRRLQGERSILAIRPSDMIDLLAANGGKSDLSLALHVTAEDGANAPVIVIDGLDESLGEISNLTDLIRSLSEIGLNNPLVATCRRREFEDHLAREMREGIFDSIYEIREWRLEQEFTDFVRRLTSMRLLESESIIEEARNRAALRTLVSRPLFARMLTFLSGDDVRSVDSTVRLYSEYIDKLSVTSDVALRNANCGNGVSAREIWVEASWAIFSNGLLHEDRFSLGAVVAILEKQYGKDLRCFSRALGQICDQWRSAGRIWTRFVHYSFFEYLVACKYLDEIMTTIETSEDRGLAAALVLDLPPEIRHFLVDELREVHIVGYADALVRAYTQVHELGKATSEVRTAGNLIAYLISRVDPTATPALHHLFGLENDLFLQQSLLWGLCHLGDNAGLLEFIDRSRKSAEWRAWNRGYLMYYYGDLDRRSDPPYIDIDRRRSWGRTRERSISLMSNDFYVRRVKPQRIFLDLYSLLDYAIWRGEKLNPGDSEVSLKVIEFLWRESDIDSDLLLELQAMFAAGCSPEVVG